MQTIYLITYQGPEWNTPVEAWGDKDTADKRAKELDSGLNTTNVFDSLSSHTVTEVKLGSSAGELEAYSDMLRELCCFLSVGGYNSDGLMPPDVANAKIRDGIDTFLKVERERAAASAQKEILSLHTKLAGETLRADQGWERYEARNKSALALEKQLEAADDGYNEIGWIASGDHGHPKYVHFKDAEPEVGTSIFVVSKAKLLKGAV